MLLTVKDYEPLSASFWTSGWFERLAAFQATCLVARRDESTRGTNPLQGEVAIVGFHLQEFPQGSSEEGAQATHARKKWMRYGCHGQDSPFSDQSNSVTQRATILSKIARFERNGHCRIESGLPAFPT